MAILPDLLAWPCTQHAHTSPSWLQAPERSGVLIREGRRRRWSLHHIATEEAIRKRKSLKLQLRNGKQICSTASWVVWALGACCLICNILSRSWKPVWWDRLPGRWQDWSVLQLQHSGRNVGNGLAILKAGRHTLTSKLAGWGVRIRLHLLRGKSFMSVTVLMKRVGQHFWKAQLRPAPAWHHPETQTWISEEEE